MAIKRKILRTTSTSRLVSLPMVWAESVQLVHGDTVEMKIYGDKIIIWKSGDVSDDEIKHIVGQC